LKQKFSSRHHFSLIKYSHCEKRRRFSKEDLKNPLEKVTYKRAREREKNKMMEMKM
jgi:hypothetical protein